MARSYSVTAISRCTFVIFSPDHVRGSKIGSVTCGAKVQVPEPALNKSGKLAAGDAGRAGQGDAWEEGGPGCPDVGFGRFQQAPRPGARPAGAASTSDDTPAEISFGGVDIAQVRRRAARPVSWTPSRSVRAFSILRHLLGEADNLPACGIHLRLGAVHVQLGRQTAVVAPAGSDRMASCCVWPAWSGPGPGSRGPRPGPDTRWLRRTPTGSGHCGGPAPWRSTPARPPR